MEEHTILIAGDGYLNEEFRRQILEIAPGARLVSAGDLARDPDLMDQVEICFGRPPLELLHQAGRLKWVQVWSAGIDWATQPPALEHPFAITAAHIHATPISEHLFAMLLALTRRIDNAVRNQEQSQWTDIGDGDTLEGKTLCILGLGTIGRRCAQIAQAMGMRVIGVRRRSGGGEVAHVQRVYAVEQLDEALRQSDIVMNLLPLTRATVGLVGARQFAAMRVGGYYLSVGRGKTTDTQALMDALRTGRLAGAGLDVTDPEPLPPEHPLWRMPNVIITPHCSGGFAGYRDQAQMLFLENLRRYLANEPLMGLADKHLGY